MVKESMKNNNHLILLDKLLVTFAVHDRMNNDFSDFIEQNQDIQMCVEKLEQFSYTKIMPYFLIIYSLYSHLTLTLLCDININKSSILD